MVVAPQPNRKKVAFVLIDGAGHDVLRVLLDRGDLPNLARWVLEPGGMTVGTTVFPSTTGVAYIPFLFGRYPGPAQVPGIRWLDRAAAAGGLRSQWRGARRFRRPPPGLVELHNVSGTSTVVHAAAASAISPPSLPGLPTPVPHITPSPAPLW